MSSSRVMGFTSAWCATGRSAILGTRAEVGGPTPRGESSNRPRNPAGLHLDWSRYRDTNTGELQTLLDARIANQPPAECDPSTPELLPALLHRHPLVRPEQIRHASPGVPVRYVLFDLLARAPGPCSRSRCTSVGTHRAR